MDGGWEGKGRECQLDWAPRRARQGSTGTKVGDEKSTSEQNAATDFGVVLCRWNHHSPQRPVREMSEHPIPPPATVEQCLATKTRRYGPSREGGHVGTGRAWSARQPSSDLSPHRISIFQDPRVFDSRGNFAAPVLFTCHAEKLLPVRDICHKRTLLCYHSVLCLGSIEGGVSWGAHLHDGERATTSKNISSTTLPSTAPLLETAPHKHSQSRKTRRSVQLHTPAAPGQPSLCSPSLALGRGQRNESFPDLRAFDDTACTTPTAIRTPNVALLRAGKIENTDKTDYPSHPIPPLPSPSPPTSRTLPNLIPFLSTPLAPLLYMLACRIPRERQTGKHAMNIARPSSQVRRSPVTTKLSRWPIIKCWQRELQGTVKAGCAAPTSGEACGLQTTREAQLAPRCPRVYKGPSRSK